VLDPAPSVPGYGPRKLEYLKNLGKWGRAISPAGGGGGYQEKKVGGKGDDCGVWGKLDRQGAVTEKGTQHQGRKHLALAGPCEVAT